jgi:hypothetical protein
MGAAVDAAASVTGHPDLLDPLQRQFELMQDVLDHERRLQGEVAARLLAPVDALFDLLEESGAAITRQAEALDAAGRALQEAASVMRAQGRLFEQTVAGLRQPSDLAKAAAGVPRPSRGQRPKPG